MGQIDKARGLPNPIIFNNHLKIYRWSMFDTENLVDPGVANEQEARVSVNGS